MNINSNKINRIRFTATEWLAGFDTRIVEFGCGLRLLAWAWSIMALDANGKSAAPFLESTLLAFDESGFITLFILTTIGLTLITALLCGTYPKRQGLPEKYYFRFLASVCATAFCIVIVLAMAQIGQPPVIIFTYGLGALLNLVDAMVLYVKHSDLKEGAF